MKKKLEILKQKTEKLIQNSEYRGVKLHGVTCSRADLEGVVFYIDTYLRQGDLNGLMPPRGEIKEVFDKAGIQFED